MYMVNQKILKLRKLENMWNPYEYLKEYFKAETKRH